jgi:hypothetical protein
MTIYNDNILEVKLFFPIIRFHRGQVDSEFKELDYEETEILIEIPTLLAYKHIPDHYIMISVSFLGFGFTIDRYL